MPRRRGALPSGRALVARSLVQSDPLAEILLAASAFGRTSAAGLQRRIGGALHSTAATLPDVADEENDVPMLPIPISASRTLTAPMGINICVDESGSVSATDPGGEAHRATLLVCDWLKEHSQNERDRIGLVRFADRAESIRPVRADFARRTIERALARGGSDLGGGTSLTPAIEELCALLGGSRREYRLVLLVTDGQVPESNEELRRLFGLLRAAADSVYLIALDADGAWSGQTHARFDSLGLSGTIPLRKTRSAELAEAIANVLVHEAGLALATAAKRRGRR